MTKYFLDTEFIEDGKTIELISIGLVCEDGRTFYAENSKVDWSKANPWVRENVLPHLWGVVFKPQFIASELVAFVAESETKPEFWAYYADYDWVVLCQLYGRMLDLPEGWPMFCMDIKQLAVHKGNPKLPKQSTTEHHALADARWNKQAYDYLARLSYCD